MGIFSSKPCPTYTAPKPCPTYTAPKPCPTYTAPKPCPTYTAPKPCPTIPNTYENYYIQSNVSNTTVDPDGFKSIWDRGINITGDSTPFSSIIRNQNGTKGACVYRVSSNGNPQQLCSNTPCNNGYSPVYHNNRIMCIRS
jgi:hypothetical protein